MGGCEAAALAVVEPSLKYHPSHNGLLTSIRYPDQEQCLVGSFTGVVASESVTEAPKGSLSLVGNQTASARAQGSLTATPTSEAGTKVGPSDPSAACGCAEANG